MRDIYIGFSKSKKFLPLLSWAIRALENTKFSHVYVKQNTKFDIDLIYQASGTQVNFMNHLIFHEKNETVREFKFEVSDLAYETYMKFALTNVGRSYGVKQIFGIGLMKLFALEKNPFPNGSADYVCSELVAEILYELLKFKIDREKFDRITPKEIFDLCLKLEAANDIPKH